MNDNKKLGVALTKCFYCQEDSTILMNTRLTEHYARQVESAHGKVIDMTPCPQCEEYMAQGVILITIDDSKSGKDWNKADIPNPYRTGGWFVVRDESLYKWMPEEFADFAVKHRFMFIEHEAAEHVGLFDAAERMEDADEQPV